MILPSGHTDTGMVLAAIVSTGKVTVEVLGFSLATGRIVVEDNTSPRSTVLVMRPLVLRGTVTGGTDSTVLVASLSVLVVVLLPTVVVVVIISIVVTATVEDILYTQPLNQNVPPLFSQKTSGTPT